MTSPLRLSSHTIFCDLSPYEVLLIHGYSGAWDIVDRELADLLRPSDDCDRRASARRLPNQDIQAINLNDFPGEVSDLLARRGYVTDLAPDDEEQLAVQLGSALHRAAHQGAPSYVLTLTYDCNLRCPYCFQSGLRNALSADAAPAMMSSQLVDKIFLAMPEIEKVSAPEGVAGDAQDRRRIMLFGGEPLREHSRALVEHILVRTQAREGRGTVSAVTNGTELHHFGDLLGPSGLSFLQITLDGPRTVHDSRRVGADGLPTFAQIVRNIDLALERGTTIKLRINLDKESVASLGELADSMRHWGWLDHENFSAYAVPLHKSLGGNCDSAGFGSWELTNLLGTVPADSSSARLIDGPDGHLRQRVRELLGGDRDPFQSLQPAFCGAHTTTWVFDPKGDIYACWECAGNTRERIGHLTASGDLVIDSPGTSRWRNRTVTSSPSCRRCPYAFFCGGGCALQAQLRHGKLNSNFCDDFGERFRRIAVEEVRARHFGAIARQVHRGCSTLRGEGSSWQES